MKDFMNAIAPLFAGKAPTLSGGEIASGRPLSEAPEIIGPSDFGLSDEGYRYRFTRYLMDLPAQVTLEDNDEYHLFRAGEGRVIYFYMLEKRFGRLAYFVKCEIVDYDFVGETVTQVALWRDATTGLVGIAGRVFFDHILTEFPTVMSDEQQTESGKGFWVLQMGVADRKGLRVGLADMRTKTIEWCEGMYSDWIKAKEAAWSFDPSSQHFRFVISR